MKFLAIAAIMAAALTLALAPAASMIYAEAYPTDGTKRAALDACAGADPLFNRLSAAERAYCYARFLQPPPPADSDSDPKHDSAAKPIYNQHQNDALQRLIDATSGK